MNSPVRTDVAILTISVAAKLLGVHARTLMLYEAESLITPQRTSTNRRMFSIRDLEKLQFIKYLTRNQGINLKGVKVILEAIGLLEEKDFNLKQVLFPLFRPKRLI